MFVSGDGWHESKRSEVLLSLRSRKHLDSNKILWGEDWRVTRTEWHSTSGPVPGWSETMTPIATWNKFTGKPVKMIWQKLLLRKWDDPEDEPFLCRVTTSDRMDGNAWHLHLTRQGCQSRWTQEMHHSLHLKRSYFDVFNSLSITQYNHWGGGYRCCSKVKQELHLKHAVVCWMCDVTQPHKRQQLERPNQVDHPFMVGLALQSPPHPTLTRFTCVNVTLSKTFTTNCPQRLGQGLKQNELYSCSVLMLPN